MIISCYRLNKSIYQRHVSRTVLMVIDAMRTDFIYNQQNTSMKYINKMINDGTACMVNLNVEVPTVTMPRIKVSLESKLRTKTIIFDQLNSHFVSFFH